MIRSDGQGNLKKKKKPESVASESLPSCLAYRYGNE